MNIYRNKINNNLYTIEHLILDIKHLNRNAHAGIYAKPYLHKGEVIKYNSKSKELCEKFVNNNFILISYK